ncbi:MAG TPA: hypothetical protein VF086_08590 [Propionibacteriaceae bacterium]
MKERIICSQLPSGRSRSSTGIRPGSAGRTVCCIGPEVHLHDLLGLGPGSRDARSAGAPDGGLHALAGGGVDAVVIAAHGRPMPGFGYYLELGSDVILTPAEMFASTPPKSLASLACWGQGAWPEQRRPVDRRYHRAGQRIPADLVT